MKVEIIEAQPWHARLALKGMRVWERKAFDRLKVDAEDFLVNEILRSEVSKSGFYGDLMALWGLKTESVFDDKVYLWMVLTNEVEKTPLVFARHSKKLLNFYFQRYKMIYAFVDSDFDLSIKWMKWLGFSGELQGTFIRFEKWTQQP